MIYDNKIHTNNNDNKTNCKKKKMLRDDSSGYYFQQPGSGATRTIRNRKILYNKIPK